MATDFQELCGGKELHVQRIANQRVGERTFFDDYCTKPAAGSLNAAGEPHGSSPNDDYILHRLIQRQVEVGGSRLRRSAMPFDTTSGLAKPACDG